MTQHEHGISFVGGLALTVSGYFRRPPDPVAEAQLRAAFAEFDRDLTAILESRAPHHPHSTPA
jgi:hypothetical protein